MSRFSLDVLQKRVFPFAEARDPDILLGAAFGEDVALVQVGGDVVAAHVDPIVGAVDEIGWLAVHVACNDIAASGVPPRWALLLVMVPTQEDEDLLEQIMIDVSRVPMPDVVRRFSRAFEFDPLRMISSGTLAVTIPPEETAEAGLALKKIGIDYAEVGVVTGGVGVTLVRGIASANYSEIRCEEDELARLWALHRPRD
ncbi:hypothetical protein KAW64_06940 [bacterium]|nr:hypothetical protein [bacterium]